MVSSDEGHGAPKSVTSMIAETYDIGRLIDCQVLSDRANATYLVTVDGTRYVLKVYAPGERSPDDLGLAGDLEWGVCHGDFQGANCHATADETVTFFDFDCCGAGWRAYDLATFRWAVTMNGADNALWTAFIAGYRERRLVRDADWDVIPTFVPIRHLWWMGTHIAHRSKWGAKWQGDRYVDQGLAFLRTWSAEHWEAIL